MLKKYKGHIIFFYIFSACALVAALFIDLKLDIFLNNPKNALAIWFCNTGEMPNRLICPLGGAVLFYFCEKKIHRVIGIIISIGGSVYLGYYLASYFFLEENMVLFGIIYGLGFGLFVIYAGKYITVPNELKKPLIILAVAGIAVMAAELSIIEGVKYLWGRVRFRDLLAAGSYEAFTSWLHPNGINGNKSFPSGHTAGAGMSYLMMLLPYVSEKWKSRKNLCFALPFIYTGTVAFTRLVMGAHYLSDVAMGGVIAFTCVIAAMRILEKKHFKVIE